MLETFLSLVMILLATAFGLFCGALSWRIFVSQRKTRQLAQASEHWPSTEGIIKEATLAQVGVRAGWEPVIRYSYSVNEHLYQGQRLAFRFTESYSFSKAQEITGRYPVKKVVRVYFDPHHPEVSVLEPGRQDTGLLSMFFVPLVLLIPAIFCLCVSWIGVSGLRGK